MHKRSVILKKNDSTYDSFASPVVYYLLIYIKVVLLTAFMFWVVFGVGVFR